MKKVFKISIFLIIAGFLIGCATVERKPQSNEMNYFLPSTGKILNDIDLEGAEQLEFTPKAIRFVPASCRSGGELAEAYECRRPSLE